MPKRPALPLDPWWRNARTLWDISLAAPQVVAQRSLRIARAGAMPNARDRREFARMGAEKAEAFGEAWLAIGVRLWQAQQQAAFVLLQQWLHPSLWLGAVGAGLKPVHRRVTANARRLGATGVRTRRRRAA